MCPEPSTSQLSFKTDWNRGEAALIWRLKHVRKCPSCQTEVVATSETIRRRPLQYIYLQCAAGCDTRRCCKRVVPVSGFLLTFFLDQEQSVFKMIGPDRFWRAFILPWSNKRGGSCCFFCKTVSVCSNHSLHWHWVYHVYVCLHFRKFFSRRFSLRSWGFLATNCETRLISIHRAVSNSSTSRKCGQTNLEKFTSTLRGFQTLQVLLNKMKRVCSFCSPANHVLFSSLC